MSQTTPSSKSDDRVTREVLARSSETSELPWKTGIVASPQQCGSVRQSLDNVVEDFMRNLTTLMAAVLMLGMMAIAANAQTQAPGAAGIQAQIKNYTPIEKAACGGWGPYCPPGTTRRCGPYRCWCAACW
jgi:hypothetical protein